METLLEGCCHEDTIEAPILEEKRGFLFLKAK